MVNQGVMLKVALGDLHEDPRGRKECRKGVKIGSIRRKAVWPRRRVISNVPDNVRCFEA